jgi:uncharacterized membrane protein
MIPIPLAFGSSVLIPLFLRTAEVKLEALAHRSPVRPCSGKAITYRTVEEYLITAVDYLRLVVEAIGAAVVGFGVLATAVRFLLTLVGIKNYSNTEIRLFLGRYLALGLEFQIGADILSTAVAPTLDDVVLLGAIVVIRTVLNYFLSKELERESQQAKSEPDRDAVRT